MKISIIGAGWYGCHVASTLKGLGQDVAVYDKADDVLTAASGNNQFRLHLGFHYARNHSTRVQSRDGFQRFIERYPTLSSEVRENVYAVPAKDSLIDFKTYKMIMSATGLEFNEVDPSKYGLVGMSGAGLCQERVINTTKARKYFKKKLGDSLRLGTNVDDTFLNKLVKESDWVIDCTWGHLTRPQDEVFYETTILFYLNGIPGLPAITLVDGQLISIYPTETPGRYTLSSVVHTPVRTYNNPTQAQTDVVTAREIQEKWQSMRDQVIKYMPDFDSKYEVSDVQLSIKTKIVGASDDRSCYVYSEGNRIGVMSGKIDTIFHAMEKILQIIEMKDDDV